VEDFKIKVEDFKIKVEDFKIKVEYFTLRSEDVGNAEPLDLGYNLASISANPSSNNTDTRIPKMNSINDVEGSSLFPVD